MAKRKTALLLGLGIPASGALIWISGWMWTFTVLMLAAFWIVVGLEIESKWLRSSGKE